jgi:hypothetical protein
MVGITGSLIWTKKVPDTFFASLSVLRSFHGFGAERQYTGL